MCQRIHPKVDDHSMRTYISQFRNLGDEVKVSDASKCCAYGPVCDIDELVFLTLTIMYVPMAYINHRV
jgi:hypothetical protein